MDSTQPISFGLSSADQNHKLLKFITGETLSRLPLTDFQIEKYDSILNWDIMSSKSIPGKSMVRFVDKINWSVFLINGKKKEIAALLELREVLPAHASIFFDQRIKKNYYNKDFMLVFPQHVDWDWCARYKKIDDYVLLKYWDKFDINILSKYQPMSDVVQREKRYVIKWNVASKWHVDEPLLSEIKNLINWAVKCKKQKLTEDFMVCNLDVMNMSHISRYQDLSEGFIAKYIKKLDVSNISRYQKLSIEFIKNHRDILSFPDLMNNPHYGKNSSIQILSNGIQWFVLDGVSFTNVNFIECKLKEKKKGNKKV